MSTERFIECHSIGVSGTTRVAVQTRPDGQFEARVGVALLGMANMDADELANANPFDESFYDNYAHGIGATEAAAIEAMKADMRSLSDSLWY